MSGRLSPSVEAYAAAGRYGSQKNTSSPMGKLGRSMRRVSDAKHVMKSLVEDQSRDARRFADADINGDQKLDFDEFLALQPARVRKKYTKAQIRSWFDQADLDRSGTLSIAEYYLWTLHNAAEIHGMDVISVLFSKYDRDMTGTLEPTEFQRMCDESGFGLAAHSIFRFLDPDGSGTISYRELTLALKAGMPTDVETKQLISSVIHTFAIEAHAETRATFDMFDGTSKYWVVTGESVAEVRANMKRLLNESGAQVIDILKQFDIDATREHLIDAMEFYDGMRTKFNYKGPLHVIDALFKELDEDNSGTVGFDELYEFVRGKRHSLDRRNAKVREMSMQPPEGSPLTLNEIYWDEDVLRLMIQQMMSRAHVGPVHVIRAWDKNKDGQLTMKEFVNALHGFFRTSEGLWEREVEPLARSAFISMATQDITKSRAFESKLSCNDLEMWLRKAPELMRGATQGMFGTTSSGLPPMLKKVQSKAEVEQGRLIAIEEAKKKKKEKKKVPPTYYLLNVNAAMASTPPLMKQGFLSSGLGVEPATISPTPYELQYNAERLKFQRARQDPRTLVLLPSEAEYLQPPGTSRGGRRSLSTAFDAAIGTSKRTTSLPPLHASPSRPPPSPELINHRRLIKEQQRALKKMHVESWRSQQLLHGEDYIEGNRWYITGERPPTSHLRLTGELPPKLSASQSLPRL